MSQKFLSSDIVSVREIPEDVALKTDQENEFPNDMWRKMGEAGYVLTKRLLRLILNLCRLLGITADEDYGGLAMGYQAHCTVMEELSRASGNHSTSPFRPIAHNVQAALVYHTPPTHNYV